jgi:15-cis-phytoene synthase
MSGYRVVNPVSGPGVYRISDVTRPLLDILTAPERLAIAYALPAQRDCLCVMLAFDAKLAVIARKASEPLIAQMRFAWWRETLAKPLELRPRGEPLLEVLADTALPNIELAMTSLIDAWELLSVSEGLHDVINKHADIRGQALFAGLANQCGVEAYCKPMGRKWALASLASTSPSHRVPALELLTNENIPAVKLPRQLRALAILHRAAILEAGWMAGRDNGSIARVLSALRLLFCASTGR